SRSPLRGGSERWQRPIRESLAREFAVMAKGSKRIEYLKQQVAGLGPVDLSTAVGALKKLEASLPKTIKPCRFDQSVALAVRLGVDPKQADQIVRGSIVLPHGIGKSQRVLVFAQGPNAKAAEEAGAD